MAAAGDSPSGLKGTKFGERIAKDAHIISRVFHKIDETHSHLVSGISQELSTRRPLMLQLSVQAAQDLTNIQNINELREALQIAVELEMTVMYEYLFACFSVVNASDEVVTPHTVTNKELSPYYSELRREYKTQLMIICLQEMDHMCMAIDMLISISGIPDLQKVEFPSKIGCDDAKADLMRLNLDSLYMFAKNEEPYPDDKTPETGLTPTDSSDFVYYSIAQLYEAIYNGFITVHGKMGDSMFEVDPSMTPMKKRYTRLDPVLEDVRLIEVQGEGQLGGKLFKEIIEKTRDWIEHAQINPVKQKEIVDLCNKILEEINDLQKLLPDLGLLIELIIKLQKSSDIKFPFTDADFLSLEKIQPSHWGRFLMMIVNYSMLNNSSKIVDDKISDLFSRPSYPRPDKDKHLPEVTSQFVDLANSSYQLLLSIFEGSILAIPKEADEIYQITARYTSIRFYPIMSILIYPLGEILSYFQLNSDSTDKTAGFPFVPNAKVPDGYDQFIHGLDVDPKTEAVNKFFQVVYRLTCLYEESKKFDESYITTKLPTCVGMWVTNETIRKKIVARVTYTLKHLLRSIEVLYKGFTNGIPAKIILWKQPPAAPEPSICVDKYYLNIEFDGYVLYSMATDFDPTYETRGFLGHQFMFEYSNDPDFTDEFYTNVTLKNHYPGEKLQHFSRWYIPSHNYEGVRITSAKLVPPCYVTKEQLKTAKFHHVQDAIKKEFGEGQVRFNFNSIRINNEECTTKFQQLNTALSRQMGIDPINVGFDTHHFSVRRANLIYGPDLQVIDYDSACVVYSQNFGVYSTLTDPRTAKSGGYLQWDSTFNTINGLLANTNLMNAKSGAGQCLSDFYTAYTIRADNMMKDIKAILSKKKYENDQLSQLIIPFLEYFPETKLITLALMANMHDPADVNQLSYVSTRYLHVKYLMSQNYKNSPYQSFYHVPLNEPADEQEEHHLTAENRARKGDLSRIEFMTQQDWCVDFWVGGYDYDALTFFMSGSLMIPVHLKPH